MRKLRLREVKELGQYTRLTGFKHWSDHPPIWLPSGEGREAVSLVTRERETVAIWVTVQPWGGHFLGYVLSTKDDFFLAQPSTSNIEEKGGIPLAEACLCVCACVFVCACAHMSVCMCVCMHVFVCVHACTHICVSMCLCVWLPQTPWTQSSPFRRLHWLSVRLAETGTGIFWVGHRLGLLTPRPAPLCALRLLCRVSGAFQ